MRARLKGRAGKAAKAQPKLVTRASAAAALGVAPNRINRWVADGAPVAVRGRRGCSAMYDLDALRAWKAGKSAGPDVNLSLAEERAKLAKAQRDKYELEYKVRTGQLVERGLAVAEGQAVMAALKARLLSLPRQCVMRGLVPREAEPGVRALVLETLRELVRWASVQVAEGKVAS